jgi:hypothetical protein
MGHISDIIRAAAESPVDKLIISLGIVVAAISVRILRKDVKWQNIVGWITIVVILFVGVAAVIYYIYLDSIKDAEGNWEVTANGWVYVMHIFNNDGEIKGQMELTGCPISVQYDARCQQSGEHKSSPIRGKFDRSTGKLSFTRDFDTPEAQDYIATFPNSHVAYGKYTYDNDQYWFAMVRH